MGKSAPTRFDRIRPVHPHRWLWEPLENDPMFVLRSMFGAKAVFLSGQLMLCFCASEEPWRGILICTDQLRHAALLEEFPEFVEHPILPKWLYLSEASDHFERTALRLVSLARKRDARIGVTPQPKRSRVRPKSARPPRP